MNYERKEFEQALEKRRLELVHKRRSEITQVAQATVPVEALTKSAEWNFFLSVLQSHIEELAGVIEGLRVADSVSPSFEHSDLAARKAQLMALHAQKATLERVRDLPKEIFEQGEKAKLALHDYTDQ